MINLGLKNIWKLDFIKNKDFATFIQELDDKLGEIDENLTKLTWVEVPGQFTNLSEYHVEVEPFDVNKPLYVRFTRIGASGVEYGTLTFTYTFYDKTRRYWYINTSNIVWQQDGTQNMELGANVAIGIQLGYNNAIRVKFQMWDVNEKIFNVFVGAHHPSNTTFKFKKIERIK